MKINKISSKLIKPHTPTPQYLKSYNLSFIDKNNIAMNFVVLLFYKSTPQDMRQQLEESLAKILVDFYPLAGRYIKKEAIINCSDEGAEFVEAEAVDVELLDLVTKPKIEQLDELVPKQFFRLDEAADDPLLSIQITHFPCGGAAVAVSFSHRVFDGASLGTFVAAWSNATNIDKGVENYHSTPYFSSPLLLPREQDHAFSTSSSQCDDTIFIRRLLFDEAALTSLRSNIIRPNNNNGRAISGVRIVCAVITKALIHVDRATHGGKTRDLIIFQPVNLRERTVPPQPKHACCNFFVTSITRRVSATEAEGIELGELVDLIGDGIRKTIDDHAEILSPDRDGRDIISSHIENMGKELWNPDTNIIAISDWSKFGFYEADFGWGKPVSVNCGPQRPLLNCTVLMSNKEGDGIEAWVYLNQNSLRFFDQDEEIKLFMA